MTHFTGTAVYFGSRCDFYIEADSVESAIAGVESQGYREGSVRDIVEREPKFGWTLVLGQGCYGAGVDLDTAKRNFRGAGGRLSFGYVVVEFDDETDYLGFGDMGYRFLGNAPKQAEVAPR